MKWLARALVGILCIASASAEPLEEQPLFLEGEGALYSQKFARARDVAEQLLRENPKNYAAQWLLGRVYLYGEGSIPRANYCFKQAERELETQKYGDPRYAEGPWRVYSKVLLDRAQAAQQQGDYNEAIRMVDKYDRIFEPKATPLKGFTLIKLGRIDEARELMLKTLDDPKFASYRGHSLNSLGNLEYESDNLEKALDYFTQIAEHASGDDYDPVYWANAGEAARDMCRLDLAETSLLKATESFNEYTYSDPWGFLAEMYTAQNRMPEALSAVKSMQAWRISGSAQVSQNKWASCYFRSGLVLMQMGYDQEAVRIFRRLIHRPDRNSATSTEPDLAEARISFVYAYALNFHLQRLREKLSYCSWRDWPGLTAEWITSRRELSEQQQRVANLICSHQGLGGFIMPYGAKSLDQPSLAPSMWSVFGASPVVAAAQKNLTSTKPEATARAPYLRAVVAEALAHNFQTEKARVLMAQVLEQLPVAEAKLRFRCQAVMSQILETQGKRAESMALLQRLMDSDPSQLRACGVALPIQIESDGSGAGDRARRWLYASPRLVRKSKAFTMSLQASGQQLEGRLSSPDGTVLGTFRSRPHTSAEDQARSFCEVFHTEAFAPVIDLSQADIRSIDGSTGVARPDLSKTLTE